jgi:uncharacterized protein
MDHPPERRSSAFYQRRHRERLRDQGLMKKELWVLPEYADDLATIERHMRKPRGEASWPHEDRGSDTMTITAENPAPMTMPAHRDDTHAQPSPWNARSLYEALIVAAPVREGAIALEWIEGAEPGLHLTMHDYGDLPLFMAVVGQQIMAEALLWPVSQVRDVARFNDEVLRTHRLFPLSTLGIEELDGEAVYIMFGALSSNSSLADILFEIETLADNVIRATEAYELHLREAA